MFLIFEAMTETDEKDTDTATATATIDEGSCEGEEVKKVQGNIRESNDIYFYIFKYIFKIVTYPFFVLF